MRKTLLLALVVLLSAFAYGGVWIDGTERSTTATNPIQLNTSTTLARVVRIQADCDNGDGMLVGFDSDLSDGFTELAACATVTYSMYGQIPLDLSGIYVDAVTGTDSVWYQYVSYP